MDDREIVRHVKGAYDKIADDYGRKRARPFPVIERLVGKIQLGETILDAGAGNGRHIPILICEGGRAVAVDVSPRMLRLCRGNMRRMGLYHRVSPVLCDISELPFRDRAFTGALYAAVLHHLPSSMRSKALEELGRMLGRRSTAILTLWSKRALKIRPDAKGIEGIGRSGDFSIPWKTPAGSEERYYHLYTAQEAREELLSSIPMHKLALTAIFEEGMNIIAILEEE